MTISFDNLIKIAKATQEAALLSEDNQSYVSDHLVNKRIEMIKKEFKEGMPKMEILFADNFFAFLISQKEVPTATRSGILGFFESGNQI